LKRVRNEIYSAGRIRYTLLDEKGLLCRKNMVTLLEEYSTLCWKNKVHTVG
jgi:hypothetical protein